MNKAKKKQAERKRRKEERICPRCKKVLCSQKALESHINGTDGLVINRCLPSLPVYQEEPPKHISPRSKKKSVSLSQFRNVFKNHIEEIPMKSGEIIESCPYEESSTLERDDAANKYYDADMHVRNKRGGWNK